MPTFDVIVVGAGAAGLMCAFTAGQRGRRVAVIEHATEAGKKILISGGGRCNFTNLHTTPANFLSENPHFCKSALARYTPSDFLALVERHRVRYHEKKLGQLFCDRAARDIVDLLLHECRLANVKLHLQTRAGAVRQEDGLFHLETSQGDFSAPSCVVATGGLSIPKIGATDWGYRTAKHFGHGIVPTRPALVPLTLSGDERAFIEGLSGVATEVIAACENASFREKMLITHRGLSGPAILQISSYWQPRHSLTIDLLPAIDLDAHRRARPQAGLRTILSEHLPRRLAERLTDNAELDEVALHNWQLHPNGTEGFEKAEVTAGGVDTRDLTSKNMESRRVPGLYFIGEVVDVTGHLGGFNFQWAWASGHAAGLSV